MRKQTLTIYSTTNYNKFKKLSGNRPLLEGHINTLAKALEEENFLERDYIRVNEDYQIIDGQHRIEAAKKARVPVYFIVQKGATLHDAINDNKGRRNWAIIDYINSYAELGNKDYIKLRDFCFNMKSLYGIQYFVSIELASNADSGGGKKMKSLKDGTLTVSTKRIKDSEKIILDLMQIRDEYSIENALHKYFARGFETVCSAEGFKSSVLFKKLGRQRKKLEGCASTAQVVEALLEIYNNRNSKPLNIKGYKQY
jgi:hypothetical protein